MRGHGRRGYSLVEKLLSLGMIAAGLYLFLYQTNSRQQALVEAAADDVVRALGEARELAGSSSRPAGLGVSKVLFSPEGGPYRSLAVTVDGQVARRLEFEPGIYLVNTNGLIVGDELLVREDGALLNAGSEAPRSQPDPGYLTLAGDQVNGIRLIEVRPAEGKFVIR